MFLWSGENKSEGYLTTVLKSMKAIISPAYNPCIYPFLMGDKVIILECSGWRWGKIIIENFL